MLYKKMQGRLGNQMFQYAAMRAFAEKFHDKDVVLDFSDLGNPSYENDLKDFKVTAKLDGAKTVGADWKKHFSTWQKVLIFYVKLRRKMIQCRFKNDFIKESDAVNKFERKQLWRSMRSGVYCLRRGYADFIDAPKAKNKYFDGYFEAPKYFNDIREMLLEEFTPKEKAPAKNRKLYTAMENSESVCISIRRGDWVENKKFNSIHFVCTPDYFKNAIKVAKEMIKKPRFFVFSDDVEWVKENMDFPSDTMYEDGTDPVWEKMRLMYSCKHFIISNSTFSWWVQYLSRNENKVVIAPSRWKNGYDMSDIYEPNWTLIDVDKEADS